MKAISRSGVEAFGDVARVATPRLTAAVAAHDGGEFLEQGSKTMHGRTVFYFASSVILERGLGSLGGGDRIAMSFAPRSLSANISLRHTSRMCRST
jgi:hypothetical protein